MSAIAVIRAISRDVVPVTREQGGGVRATDGLPPVIGLGWGLRLARQ